MLPDFAGAHFDFSKKIWKCGNVIENDATIEMPTEDIVDLAPEGLAQNEVINS